MTGRPLNSNSLTQALDEHTKRCDKSFEGAVGSCRLRRSVGTVGSSRTDKTELLKKMGHSKDVAEKYYHYSDKGAESAALFNKTVRNCTFGR